ncbi:MAG: vitamin B12 dependent-methionine synthase activation domain-containing protein, partial [Rhizomicrobium sp.]
TRRPAGTGPHHRRGHERAGSSVSGFYYAHPESRYFGVGKIERDQVEDYARRKNWTVEEAERWLAPLLNYNPRAVNAA